MPSALQEVVEKSLKGTLQNIVAQQAQQAAEEAQQAAEEATETEIHPHVVCDGCHLVSTSSNVKRSCARIREATNRPCFIIVYPCCSYMYWTGTCSLFAQLLAQVSRTHSRAGATIRCPATEVQRLPGLGLVPIRCPFIPINFEVAGFNCHVSSSLSISITVTRNAQLSKSKVQFPSPSSL